MESRVRKVFILFIILFVVCFGYYYWKDTRTIEAVQIHVTDDIITVSADSGFYNESIYVSLSKNYEFPHKAKIYYTLDGNDPTIDDMEYISEIELMPGDGISVYPLKSVIYYNGEYSDIVERTYILCSDVTNKYDLDIVSITSDEYNLYDYEYGILVPGKIYDDNVAAGATVNISGNYNKRGEDWIRDAHVSMFNAAGEVVLEQDVGLEVAGGTSSSYDVKSLKIYADEIYDENNDKLELNLINEGVTWSAYSFVDRYNSIKLRSGSQDQGFGNIRSSVVSRLAQMSNFDGCTATNRCIVYLNGDFYGIFDMQQNYSKSYLANRFGLEDSECVVRYKSNETTVFSYSGLTEYFMADLNDEVNRTQLEQRVDMDNCLLYYAVSILCNNTDWPGNNYEIWCYTGEYDSENIYTDGRYRFLLFDTDLTFTTEETLPFFEGCQGDIFESLMEGTHRANGSVFSNIMESTYYRDKFITIICDLLNTSFSRENTLDVIDSENQKIKSARRDFYDEEFVDKAEFYVTEIMRAAIKRPREVKSVIKTYFGLEDVYELELKNSGGINVYWNNMNIYAEEEYSCGYYEGVSFVLSQEAYPGYVFRYWLVNGEKIYDANLIITDSLIRDGKIYIEAVAEMQDTEVLTISELSAEGAFDWIEITNAGQSDINIHDYYISDDEKQIMKYQLPELVLEAGESVIIYGSKNYNSIGDYICNFSLSSGETLYLSKDNRICDSVKIPRMSNSETYGRYSNSNVWVFYNSLVVEE